MKLFHFGLQGLLLSKMKEEYRKYFQCSKVFPEPSSMEPGCTHWRQVFRKSIEFRDWFQLDKNERIKVLPRPERDLVAFFFLLCYTSFLRVRDGAKNDNC